MKRSLQTLQDRRFDVLIVGGGIYGATLAREASRKGYSIALIEKGDFGAGVSANSLRTLHGGLRYLQHFDLPRMRESIYSRRYFLQFAPELIENVPFVIPLKGWGIKGPLAMRAALLMNDLISFDRNSGVVADKRIPGGRIVGPSSLKEIIPMADDHGLTGGAVWYESIATNPERLMLELVKDADRHGAVCANYVEATSLTHEEGRVSTVKCVDDLTGETLEIQTQIVVDTSGQASGCLGRSLPDYSAPRRSWCRGVNFIVNKSLFGDKAVGLTYRDHVVDRASKIGSGERYLFFVPWKDQTMVGTFYDLAEETDDGLRLSEAERRSYIKVVNTVLGEELIQMQDITRWHSGWLPLESDLPPGQIDLAKDHSIRLVGSDGEFSGLVELTGVKLTTAPAVASELLDRLKQHIPPAGEKPTELLGTLKSADRGADLYAVLRYAVEEEMACRLEDVVMRRTSIADEGRSEAALIDQVSQKMAEMLSWDEGRRQAEIGRLQAHLDAVC